MDNVLKAAECIPFILAENIGDTIEWYERLGFTCTATNRIWEPDCELNWARIEWAGAGFMIGIDGRETRSRIKDSSLWFNVDAIEEVEERLINHGITFEKEEATFYGRKVISFKDINGYGVSFSCSL